MKVLTINPDGSRIVRLTRADWCALDVAVVIAYEDMESVPEEFRGPGGSLLSTFNQDASESGWCRRCREFRALIPATGRCVICKLNLRHPRKAATVDGTSYFAFPEAGCWLAVVGDVDNPCLLSVPALADGAIGNADAAVEVTSPEGLDLGAVNLLFGTALTAQNFPGR